MISREEKQQVSDIMAHALERAGMNVQRVNYRTFNIRIPNEYGVSQYLNVQVKEIL